MFRFGCFFFVLALTSCQQKNLDIKESRFLLGTLVEFTVYTSDEDKALLAIAVATNVMQQVENDFTIYGEIENSVKRFNRAHKGECVKLDAEVDALLVRALSIQKVTQGGFDPTLGNLNKLWGFSSGGQTHIPPGQKQISLALAESGVTHLSKKTCGWSKNVEGLALDFGAIAKGYAIDKGIDVLKNLGFSNAIINAGGDMRVTGKHGGRAWHVAIRHPRDTQPLGWLELEGDKSVVTSGDYERFYMYQGQRFHHILNPSTGYPAILSQSITVVAENATLADALSTGLFVMGGKKGLPLVESMFGVEALWVDKAGVIVSSKGLRLMH